MSMVAWAERELDRLMPSDDTDADAVEMQKTINDDILQMVRVFSEQGHSGFSSGYALSIIKRLLAYKPITPLTGDDDEWCSPFDNEGTQQNKRCSAVFRKNFDNSTAYYLDGKVFSDNGGESWFSSKGLGSFTPVTFPFTVPEKPEYIILETCPTCKGKDSDGCETCRGYGGVLPN